MNRRQMNMRMFSRKDAKYLIGKGLPNCRNAFEIKDDFRRLLNIL